MRAEPSNSVGAKGAVIPGTLNCLILLLGVLTSAGFLTGCGSDAFSATPAAPTQAPALPGAQPIAAADRVYTADQTSNTVTVISPATNTVLGTIALGNARPDDLLGALYSKQITTHGLGFSPDGTLLAAVNVTTNSVSVIETATNTVKGTVYLRRAPHEAFFTPDGKEIWVAVRGEGHVSVIDVASLKENGTYFGVFRLVSACKWLKAMGVG